MTTSQRRIPVWLAVVAASLPMFMATLDNLVITNALPAMRADLGASIEELQWYVNAFTLAFATFILAAAALGDRIGRRTVFLAGILVFTAASALVALSTESWMVIASRAVQGVGAAGIMPLSLTLLAGAVPPRLRPAAIGIWGGVAGLGVALGPLIGGAVVEGWNWQAIFWLNVPIGIVAIPLAVLALPNTLGARLRIDLPGVALAGLGVLGIVFGIVRGNDAGWDSLEVVGSLAVGTALLAAFLLWERRASAPLLPLRLFRDRSFSAANVVGFAFSFGMFGAVFLLIQFLQVVQGASALEAGVQTMPWTLAPMVVAPLAGFVAPRVGTRTLIVAGLALQTVALVWIAATMSPEVAYSVLVAPFLLAGVGMGLVFAPMSTAVLANMGEDDHAKASATNSTLREVGVALGIAALTAVFTGAGGELTPTGYVDAAVPAVLAGAAALAVALVGALFLPAGRATAATSPAADATASAGGAGGEASGRPVDREPTPVA
ncbi:DHA2 family efflux MFS transporter permease subunit [Agromyces sp. CFH 90414]|uniref:DHA2 family efflux MFS transporter permease subunit n=1 Tax=Agromyces agglutinans TaxID=2662258 RepID=A0A6I2FCX1_9MICO|nr:DHA2 family efflux MFS transporter permease subunit [Agromyces agglutinans]MRG59783.1 DHA2 family efflux MFS transporter permease subunit [Agromyces agglutinans]